MKSLYRQKVYDAISFLVIFHLTSIAQSQDVVVGFSDHSLLAGFSESEIVERQLQRDINYRIVLGGLERVRGEVIPEASERLRGDVTKITYEVSEEFTGQDVYEFFQEQLQSKSYELLFSCQGRECGSSNYWANDIFRNRILYGPERNQYYMAFRGNAGLESDPFFSLYIITRVNRTIYAHVEIVEPAGTRDLEQVAAEEVQEVLVEERQAVVGEINIVQQLQQQGSVILPQFNFQSNDRLAVPVDVAAIVDALNSNDSLSVYVVAHLQQGGQSLQELMRRSTARANSVRQALIAAGISAQRIEAAGVGPLAPTCSLGDCANRVELVLR
jgi:outer membrane protein OmpA-like peptidoglycan-associated protein